MFTGIVSDIGRVARIVEGNDVRRLSIACSYDRKSIDIGASIACGGVCMTVVALDSTDEGRTVFDVEAAPETLATTNVRDWAVGTQVNLERSLKIGDELGGHMVSGHVDGVVTIVDREDIGDTARFSFAAPQHLARFIAPKGSVALDGTSLTVNRVDGHAFDCLIIPHTLAVTTWGARRAGDLVNIEVDTVARYIARLAQAV
jgi:riboflavin synthase